MNYYTNEEVSLHCYPDDCWIILFQKVYDLTLLIKTHRSSLTDPIIKFAGKSVSHWFNEQSGDPKTFIDPKRNIRLPYTPDGRYVHIPPPDPVDGFEIVEKPWWKDDSYVIGQITSKNRHIRIFNMTSKLEDILIVCHEDSITRIMERYCVQYNKHATSYTWKSMINNTMINLEMSKNLNENDIKDETDTLESVGLSDDMYIPTLYIYYNDDLTCE